MCTYTTVCYLIVGLVFLFPFCFFFLFRPYASPGFSSGGVSIVDQMVGDQSHADAVLARGEKRAVFSEALNKWIKQPVNLGFEHALACNKYMFFYV